MYILNKIVGWWISPVGLAIGAAVVASILFAIGAARGGNVRFRAAGRASLALMCVWTWFWMTPFAARLIGVPLERGYLRGCRVPTVSDYARADAIVLHGGSMGYAPVFGDSSEMWTSADRVWMAARLFKADKAPKLFVTGRGCERSTRPLLMDFGLPTNAIVYADGPLNTEQEARFIDETLRAGLSDGAARPRVLVVTSAWHMLRALSMYAKYAPSVEAIPAPCDFENTLGASSPLDIMDFLPNPPSFLWNSVCFHEWVGYLGYRWFRR